jgi:hypothetical protein
MFGVELLKKFARRRNAEEIRKMHRISVKDPHRKTAL